MIDMLEMSIQFDASLVETVDDSYAFVNVDLFELDIPLGSKSVHLRDDGTVGTSNLYHPYESLPTSFTGIALKVHFDGHFFPHVTLKASPAKIMQGHNVFGTDNLEVCVVEMLYWLRVGYPSLYALLAIQTADVRRLDVTYMSHVDSPKKVRAAIDFMSRISNGQTKPTKSKKYETTVYWGGQTSRLIRQKCYSKWDEFKSQLDKLQKDAKQGDANAIKIANAMSDERLWAIARNSLRWECTLMKRWLQRNDIPTNAWDMIAYQKQNNDFLTKAWTKGFDNIFDAIRGQDMKIVTDDKVLARLKAKFSTTAASGKISYRKAINLFAFYTQLKAMGYQEMKVQKLYSNSRFNELVADLRVAGFSKAYLQNMTVDTDSKTIPFVEIIKVDFNNQVPSWYQEPIATPLKVA